MTLQKRNPHQADRKKKNLKIPHALMNELDKLARQKGWTTTRLVTKILDEFVEWAKRG